MLGYHYFWKHPYYVLCILQSNWNPMPSELASQMLCIEFRDFSDACQITGKSLLRFPWTSSICHSNISNDSHVQLSLIYVMLYFMYFYAALQTYHQQKSLKNKSRINIRYSDPLVLINPSLTTTKHIIFTTSRKTENLNSWAKTNEPQSSWYLMREE